MLKFSHMATLAVSIAILFGITAGALAGVPAVMSYQGRLLGGDGKPVTDDSYNVVFDLYAQASDGASLWTESHPIQVAGGLFSVLLGSINPLPDSAFQGTTWLETKVNGIVLSPRTQIVSAGYAFRSKTAETVPDGSIGETSLADGSVTSSKLASGAVTSTKIASSAVTSTKINSGAVTSSKLGSGSVTYDKLSYDVPRLLSERDSFVNVRDYGAIGDGSADDTWSFQAALNAASTLKSAIVYVPSGTYKIAGHLTMPGGVTMEGVFRAPRRYYGTYTGSTLLAYEGRGNADGTPFIQMHAECTIKGITIVYPEQSRTDPVAYPWCIRGEGDNNTIADVLLVNPWQAVDFATYPCGRHLVRNLYAQPLRTGISINKCLDVGRLEDVHLWPFWEPGLIDYTKQNATAFKIAKTDWQFVSGSFCYGYKIGFHFAVSVDGSANVLLTNSGADDCPVAALIDQCQGYNGLAWSNCQFFGKIQTASTNTGIVKFDNCNFWGLEPDPRIADLQGSGQVNFTGCSFKRWDFSGQSEPAIYANCDRLTVTGCAFMEANKKQITLGPNFWSAIITNNQMYGPKSIERIGTDGVLLDNTNTGR